MSAGTRLRSVLALGGGLALLAGSSLPIQAVSTSFEQDPITVNTRVIDSFEVGSQRTRFGDFEFVGGLEMSSSNTLLGAMSGIRLAADRQRFLGVMDTGYWFAGRLMRDDAERPIGMDGFTVSPILDAAGEASDEKWLFDAEGLVVRDDEVLVSFERNHRIDIYPAERPGRSTPKGTLPLLIPRNEFRGNRGLEMVAIAPETSQLAGAVVAISERSLNDKGDLFAAILTGPSKGLFFVKRDPPYDVTDGDFLPNGDLLLLERRFSIAQGVGMRIRRIDGSRLGPGNLVDGQVILEADYGYQIDNMEGLDVTTDDEGQVFVTLVSDDNHSILQRNLLLEFRYIAD